MEIIECDVKSALTFVRDKLKAFLKGLPTRISLNPYIGCFYCCRYCYNKFLIRFRREYRDVKDICEKIIVKSNLPNILEKEIRDLEKSVIWVGSICDPYQPVESKFELTRKSLEILVDAGFPFSVYTKSDLVLRDIDLFKKSLSEVIFTVTSTPMNKKFKILFEPRTPSYSRILETLEDVSKITDTRVAILPIIPYYNDNIDDIKDLMKEIKTRGAKNVFVGFLRLTPIVIRVLKEALEEKFDKIWEFYGEKFAGAYIPKEEYRKKILKPLFDYSKEIDLGFYVEDPLPFYNKKATRIDKFYYATYQDFLFFYSRYKDLNQTYDELTYRFKIDVKKRDLERLLSIFHSQK